jgi:hypothetical protein
LHVGKGLASPQPERLAQQRRRASWIGSMDATSGLFYECEEAVLVDVVSGCGEPVTGPYKLEQRRCASGAQHLAHSRYAHLKGAAGPIGAELGPELSHEAVGADSLTVVNEEQGQQGPVLRRRRRYVNTLYHCRERPEHSEGDLHYPGS